MAPAFCFFRRTGEAAQHAAHVSDGRAKVLPGFQGTRLLERSQFGLVDSNHRKQLQRLLSYRWTKPECVSCLCGSGGQRSRKPSG